MTEFARCLAASTDVSPVGSCEVDHRTSIWLGLGAFDAALSKKQSAYMPMLRLLRLRLAHIEASLPKHDVEELRGVVAPCDSLLAEASWR